MNYTNDQLKQALSKMLPDEIFFGGESDQESTLRWNNTLGLKVANTELLHLCWMVEETLTLMDLTDLGCELAFLTEPRNPNSPHWGRLSHATWQQRVIALCKVKGVEIV